MHVKYPLFLYDFNDILSQEFFEEIVTNLMKISPVGAELFHVDGQT
jgi:hypothetical protein